MGNLWDIEQPHPLSGRKTRKGKKQRKAKRAPEEQMSSGVNQLMKTTSDFTMGAMGIAVMSNLGSQAISGLAKK